MDDLTQKERKSIIIKMIISIVLLITMIIIGLVLTIGDNIIGKLKGNITEMDEKASSTCEDLVLNNYGYIKFRSPDYDDERLKEILPVTLIFKDRNTGEIYNKKISIKDIICYDCDDKQIKIPVGNYDMKVIKPGFLYNFYEDTTISSNKEIYLGTGFFNLIRGDLNNDGLINDNDLIEPEEKIQNINSWYKKGGLYEGEYIIDQEDFTLTYGQTKQLSYHTSDYFKKTGTPSWYSYNSKVAKVENGLVTPMSVGTAKITVDNSQYVKVSVIESGSILLDETDITMNGIETKQINYKYSDDNTFGDSKPKFTSSDTSVAMVDENGTIKSLKKGTAIITVKAGFNTTETINVTVNDVDAEDFKIEEKEITFDGYEQKQIELKPIPSNATIYKYNYEVVDDTYASVTTDGLVTSKKSGTTKVKVTLVMEDKEISKYIDIKINYVQTESISYNITNLNFIGSETKNVLVTYYPSNGLDRKIIATSDDVYKNTTEKILSVYTRDGNISISSDYPGNATINFMIHREQGEDLTGVITASVSDVPIDKIYLTNSGDFGLRTLKQMTLTASPSNYTLNHSYGGIISATSSNTGFATIGSFSLGHVNVWRKVGRKGSSNICVKTSDGRSICATVYKN